MMMFFFCSSRDLINKLFIVCLGSDTESIQCVFVFLSGFPVEIFDEMRKHLMEREQFVSDSWNEL